MLDINLFRVEKGHNPEIIRESQRRRGASIEVVDEVINLDKEWRKHQFELKNLRKEFNKINTEVSKLKRGGEDAAEFISKSKEIKKKVAVKEVEAQETVNLLNSKLETIGNLVHDSVPISNDDVEQFCITTPNDNDSWDKHEEMLKKAEHFYEALNIPYQIVSIVSGALNSAAAKKYHDYQARKLEIRYGQTKKSSELLKQYVHLLNSTLTATQRTICCILENNQKEDGVVILKVLRPFMGGKTFLPFKNQPNKEAKGALKHVQFNRAGHVPFNRVGHILIKFNYEFHWKEECSLENWD
ncbi:seryl-tRNA synthetase/serine-tRNA ligase, putative [Medicago truncatula]|uniref:Seryl-tRNA synthetase/serine-tRNA ligase, putative n=1 Tax=Medicago truncatula TaxID=3880 RepID=A0A072TYT1_MEDTR|nr:seryl-tRNA synthetase/serine-tRNA ligase, putative [Medicago truncatula]